MNIHEIRKQNLIDLQEKSGLPKGKFAESCDVQPAQFSQIYAGRGMGGKLARKVEKELGLPDNYMDVLHNSDQKIIQPVGEAVEEPRAPYFADKRTEREDTRLLYVALVEADNSLKSQGEMFGEEYSFYDLARSAAELFRELRNEDIDLDEYIKEIRQQEQEEKVKTG